MRSLPYVRCSIFVFVVMLMLGLPATSGAQVAVGITVGFAPPDLPVYEQPLCPGEGYIWTPGFWAWDDDYDDYYWVPGTWVLAPEPGFLWTPAYWGWGGSGFVFYPGYWSFGIVGFYGGIDYGYGYFGHGYEGGRWEGDRFFYNRSVNNVNVTIIHNVYNTTVVNERNVTRVSYNGGNGGVNARPTPQEEQAAHARHLPPAAPQRQHIQEARSNPQLRASVNRGKPPIAATPTPNAFSGRGVVPARQGGAIHGGPRNAGPGNAGRNIARPENNNSRRAVHPNDLPPLERPAPPTTVNSKQERKYEKQQEKLYAQQEKDRQKLQQRQEKEHQQLAKQNANDARRQQVEQRHQQQTEQLQQRHSQQQQRMQQRQPQSHSAPPPPPPREKH
jgi:WXXGXW repeat (2 copies)